MKVFIRTDRDGNVTIHKTVRNTAKGDFFNSFLNRDNETVTELRSASGILKATFIEVELHE